MVTGTLRQRLFLAFPACTTLLIGASAGIALALTVHPFTLS